MACHTDIRQRRARANELCILMQSFFGPSLRRAFFPIILSFSFLDVGSLASNRRYQSLLLSLLLFASPLPPHSGKHCIFTPIQRPPFPFPPTTYWWCQCSRQNFLFAPQIPIYPPKPNRNPSQKSSSRAPAGITHFPIFFCFVLPNPRQPTLRKLFFLSRNPPPKNFEWHLGKKKTSFFLVNFGPWKLNDGLRRERALEGIDATPRK